jgi:16S rRNA (uracil1498-N3)-methyltransferase
MTYTRLFIDDDLRSGAALHLDGEKAHYIGRVLRLRTGDALTVFNGRDGEFSTRVDSIARNHAVLLLGEPLASVAESGLKIHLVQGISRGDRMDFVVQKATELGVKRITPLLTKHGVVRLDGARAAKRREHWQGIAENACEQSGRIRPPLIDPPAEFNAWLGDRTAAADTDLILRPGASLALAAVARPETKICLLIGPEGGFSDKEYEDAGAADFTAVSLGPRTLRTETAALAAVAVAQTLWGDLA